MHSPRDTVVNFEQGRWLARTIPNARFVELSGQDHAPWFDCADQVIGEMSEFITGVREPLEIGDVDRIGDARRLFRVRPRG